MLHSPRNGASTGKTGEGEQTATVTKRDKAAVTKLLQDITRIADEVGDAVKGKFTR